MSFLLRRAPSPSATTWAAGTAWAVTLAAATWLTVRSLGWPLVHDGPLMHYVASRLLDGAAPYRDLFDMNLPGVYFVHALGLMLLGRGDAAFRAFDLLLLAGAVAGLGVLLSSYGRSAILAGGALFWLYHVSGGAWRAGQRDLVLCVPLAWAAAFVLRHLRSGRLLPLGLAGLGLGVAVWIKPHVGLLTPLLAGWAWRVEPRDRKRALGVTALGLMVPAVVVCAWLAATGGLGAFVDIVAGYLIPLYGRLGRVSLLRAVLGEPLVWWTLVGLGAWALLGLVALRRTGRVDAGAVVLLLGIGYGVCHFVIQGKGWEYHLYPFGLAATALGAAGFGSAVAARHRLAIWLGVTLVGTAVILTVKGSERVDTPWIAATRARAHAVAEALRPAVDAGGTVQVLDTTAGGVHALYLLRAHQPTRFLYDFHFYHDVEHAYVRGLRAELLANLSARPPAAVALFERAWPAGGYDRLARFPALAEWLARGYALAHEGDGYRIYAARSHR